MSKVIGIDLGTTNSCMAIMDGSDVKVIESVEKEQPLVRLIPAEKSIDGTNVRGQPVPGKDGENLPLPIGTNTSASAKDPDILMANIAGIVKREGVYVI